MTKLLIRLTAAALLCAPALAAAPIDPPLPPPRPMLEAPALPSAPALPPVPPLPPVRPKDEVLPQAEAPTSPPPIENPVCAAIDSGRLVGVTLPSIPGEAGCGVPTPVRITAITLRNGGKLKLSPEAVLNCEMAGVVADFLDDETARMEKAGIGRTVEVQHAGAYECRGRNRVVGAKLSEHALGNAIDVRTFVFADKRKITIGIDKVPAWVGLKAAACARFGTILGPGSDAEHKDHLHLDLRKRRSSSICQWTLD